MSDSTPSVSTQELVDYLDLVREMLEEDDDWQRRQNLADELERRTSALKRQLRAQVGK